MGARPGLNGLEPSKPVAILDFGVGGRKSVPLVESTQHIFLLSIAVSVDLLPGEQCFCSVLLPGVQCCINYCQQCSVVLLLGRQLLLLGLLGGLAVLVVTLGCCPV